MQKQMIIISFAVLMVVALSFDSFGAERKIDESKQAKGFAKSIESKPSANMDVESTEFTKDPGATTSADPNIGEQINWEVLAGGGGIGLSTSFILGSTVGQTVSGFGISTSYNLDNGFWQNFGEGGCCVGVRGNANNDPLEKVQINDITYLIDYLFGIPPGLEPLCRQEGNANGDIGGKINISDVTYIVDYLFGIPLGPAPPACL